MKNLIAKKLFEMVEEQPEMQNYMFFNNLKTVYEAIGHMLEMDPSKIDEILTNVHNRAADHIATATDDIEEVYHFLNATMGDEQDTFDGETEAGYQDEYGSVEDGAAIMNEAEYKGKAVKLGKPMKGDVKKFKVFVKNEKGNVIKVNFGDKNMEIKRDNPERRKSFRARHKCSQAKDRTTPKYWSCKMWSKKPVSKIVGENLKMLENNRIFVQKEDMTQPITKPITKPATPKKPIPSRKDKPFLPDVTPGTKTQPKAVSEGMKDYEIYHKTLNSVISQIEKYAMIRGYDPIEFGTFDVQHVAYGETKRIRMPLTINGTPTKKMINAQIYRMDSGTYELNMYIG